MVSERDCKGGGHLHTEAGGRKKQEAGQILESTWPKGGDGL